LNHYRNAVEAVEMKSRNTKRYFMIGIFKIELSNVSAEFKWSATIAMDTSTTLVELHQTIQKAVEFGDDHLYRFYIARTERSNAKVLFDDENGKIYSTTLKSIYPLEAGHKLYYHFDYGDDWMFKVSKSRKKEFQAKKGVQYPLLIKETGDKQEQYPAWDEDDC